MMYVAYNEPNQMSFRVAEYTNNERNPLWDKLVDLKYVFIQKFGYFEIEVSRANDGINEIKTITGKSIDAAELGQLFLYNFEVNSEDIDDENYDPEHPIKFYNPIDLEHSLLHLILEKAPAWKIGHVDDCLWDMQRTFDVDNVAIYDFLTGDVSDEFKCIFQFDDFNRLINVYNSETAGDETPIFISHENVINENTIEADTSQIKNCFKVVGGEGIYINEVNPNGTDYIWKLTDEDMKDMSVDLVKKLETYDKLYSSKMEEFETVMKQLQVQMEVILELESKRIPDDHNSTNWKLYCLAELEEKEKKYLNNEDVYKEKGFGLTTNSNYTTLYVPNHNLLLAVQAEIKVRKQEIKNAYKKQDDILKKVNAIQDLLNLENYLTINGDKSLWHELILYRREDIYQNTNYSITEQTTEEERFDMTKELFKEANEELDKARTPKYSFTVDMNNILALPTYKEQNEKYFKLGNFFVAEVNTDDIIKTRLMSVRYDFNDITKIEANFSEFTKPNDVSSILRDAIDKATSAATSYNSIKRQYDKDKNKINWVDTIIHNGLNAAVNEIRNADNMDIVINHRGILCRKFNEEKQDYELEQMHLINNQIVFSDDAWKSARMALGKIHVVDPNGNETDCYGVIGDALVGRIMITKYLYVSNDNNTFTIDDDGFHAWSQDRNTYIKIDPNNSKGLMEIYKNYQNEADRLKIFWIDEDGSLHITGLLEACRFVATNGKNTIDINPDDTNLFQIKKNNEKILYFDENGNGHFKGHIDASSISLTDCTGITINNNNGTFKVDADGNMYSIAGYIGGFTIREDCFEGGSNYKYVRISCRNVRDGKGGWNNDVSGIELGLVKDKNEVENSIVRIQANGIVRFGLTTEKGSIRFNYPHTDGNSYSIFTEGFKILKGGRISDASLDYETAIKAFDKDNNEHDLIKCSGENKVVIGQMSNPHDMQIFGKDKIVIYIGKENSERIYVDSEGVSLKGNCYVGSKSENNKIATQKDLKDLESKMSALIDKAYIKGYNSGHSDGYSSGYSDGYSSGSSSNN